MSQIFKLQTGLATDSLCISRQTDGFQLPSGRISLISHSNSSKEQFHIPKVSPYPTPQCTLKIDINPGNWSLFTTTFSQLPLYNYCNLISAQSILQVEEEMLQLLEEDGPYDGVIGYSGGASLASQLIIRDWMNNPSKLPHERLFKWAVFINAGTPLEVFRISDVEVKESVVEDGAPEEAHEMLLRPSNIRVRKGNERHPDYDPGSIKRELMALKTRQLADGRLFMEDGEMGIARYDGIIQGPLIDIPTLHVRSPTAKDRHEGGLGLLELCEPTLVKEMYHNMIMIFRVVTPR